MKQETTQTTWLELKLWQTQALSRLNRGYKKGEVVMFSAGRQTGKSYLRAMHMAGSTFFGSGTERFYQFWEEWQDTFVWRWQRKESVESGKKVWGNIKMRYNRVAMDMDGRQKQYATRKEVFLRKLKGEDQ